MMRDNTYDFIVQESTHNSRLISYVTSDINTLVCLLRQLNRISCTARHIHLCRKSLILIIVSNRNGSVNLNCGGNFEGPFK